MTSLYSTSLHARWRGGTLFIESHCVVKRLDQSNIQNWGANIRAILPLVVIYPAFEFRDGLALHISMPMHVRVTRSTVELLSTLNASYHAGTKQIYNFCLSLLSFVDFMTRSRLWKNTSSY